MYGSFEGRKTTEQSSLKEVLSHQYFLIPEVSVQGDKDTQALMETLLQTRGKYFFSGDTLKVQIKPFEEVLDHVNSLPTTRNAKNWLSIVFPDVDFAGHPSKLVVQAYVMHRGRPGKPAIIQIPGYGSKPGLNPLQSPLLFGQFGDYTHIGLEVFHGLTDAVKVANHLANLQAAFALSTRMLGVCIRVCHEAGLETFVVGASFGGKTISSHLNELARSGDLNPNDIADGYVPVQGGLFIPTFTGRHYTNRMFNPEMAQHEALQQGYALPAQAPLPIELTMRVASEVNTTDDVALGQEECWVGTSMYRIQGTHFSGPAKNILGVRRFIHDFIVQKAA